MWLLLLLLISEPKGWLWYNEDTTRVTRVKPPEKKVQVPTPQIPARKKSKADSLLAIAPKWTPPPNAKYLMISDTPTVYGPWYRYQPLPSDTDFSDIPILKPEEIPEPLLKFTMYPTVENAKRWLLFYNRLLLRSEKMAQAMKQAAMELGMFQFPADQKGAMAYTQYGIDFKNTFTDSIRNRYILLFFFSPRDSVFNVYSLDVANMLYENGFIILGVFSQKDKPYAAKFSKKFKVEFPVQMDNSGLIEKIGIKTFPTLVAFEKGKQEVKQAFHLLAEGTFGYDNVVKQLILLYLKRKRGNHS